MHRKIFYLLLNRIDVQVLMKLMRNSPYRVEIDYFRSNDSSTKKRLKKKYFHFLYNEEKESLPLVRPVCDLVSDDTSMDICAPHLLVRSSLDQTHPSTGQDRLIIIPEGSLYSWHMNKHASGVGHCCDSDRGSAAAGIRRLLLSSGHEERGYLGLQLSGPGGPMDIHVIGG